MSNIIPDAIAARSISDEFQLALFTLLLEHFGEEIGSTRSINSDKAVLAVLPVVSQLMASWAPKQRHELMRAFEDGTNEFSRRLAREYEQRGSVRQ